MKVEMTLEQIRARIERGDLAVFVDEEYSYRQWFWFPNMTAESLMDFWQHCDFDSYYYDPSKLPGEMVTLKREEEVEGADLDPRSDLLFNHKTTGKQVEDYDCWMDEHYPLTGFWNRGFYSKDTWRAHIHEKEDSWLLGPGETH